VEGNSNGEGGVKKGQGKGKILHISEKKNHDTKKVKMGAKGKDENSPEVKASRTWGVWSI